MGCDDPDCCAEVCELDPSCCLDEWDELCAELAEDQCQPCVGDLNDDGVTDVVDLNEVIENWDCTAPPQCRGDANGDGVVGVGDMVLVILNWGECR